MERHLTRFLNENSRHRCVTHCCVLGRVYRKCHHVKSQAIRWGLDRDGLGPGVGSGQAWIHRFPRLRVEFPHLLDRRGHVDLGVFPRVNLSDVVAFRRRTGEIRVTPEESIGKSAGCVIHLNRRRKIMIRSPYMCKDTSH